MDGFLETITSWPTVVYTVLFGVCLLYWCLSLLSGFDFDIDADVDLDVDGDVDADGESGGLGLAGLIATLGLGGVPISMALSFLMLFAWLFSALLSDWLLPFVSGAVLTLVTVAIGLGALVLAVIPASLCVRPMRRLFVTHKAERKAELVGRVCEITTGRVDAHFGQAEVRTGGAPHLVQVRCARENDLRRGSTAVIAAYDREDETYDVAPAEGLDDRSA